MLKRVIYRLLGLGPKPLAPGKYTVRIEDVRTEDRPTGKVVVVELSSVEPSKER